MSFKDSIRDIFFEYRVLDKYSLQKLNIKDILYIFDYLSKLNIKTINIYCGREEKFFFNSLLQTVDASLLPVKIVYCKPFKYKNHYFFIKENIKKRNSFNTCLRQILSICDAANLINCSYDEFYLFILKYISNTFEKIWVVNKGDLTQSLTKDLQSMGKEVKLINLYNRRLSSLNEKEVIVHPYRTAYKWMNEFNYSISLYHMLFSEHASPIGLSYDKNVVNNLYPRLKQKGVKLFAVEELTKYEYLVNRSKRSRIDNLEYKTKLENFLGYSPYNEDGSTTNTGFGIKCDHISSNDCKCSHYNVSGGERVTVGSNYEDTIADIYFVGYCFLRGAFVNDENTIESILQAKMCGKYNVHNITSVHAYIDARIASIPLKRGDIIVVQADDDEIYEKAGIKLIRLNKSFTFCEEKVEEYVWDDPYHVNAKMNLRIADDIYSQIMNSISMNDTIRGIEKKSFIINRQNILYAMQTLKYNNLINDYYNKYKWCIRKGNNGAIVMNCNPFTYGHRYLIEEAAKQVENLYVFVVEENKSIYSFDDRLTMVKRGTSDIDNVIVIPSGRAVISTMSLPGYFNKADLQNQSLYDAYVDLVLFCDTIAPLFHVKVRYVGEEPIDKYTKRYNEQMKIILPEYGIDLVEIKRKQICGDVISATLVRKMHKNKDWNTMRKYCPQSTLEVLKK